WRGAARRRGRPGLRAPRRGTDRRRVGPRRPGTGAGPALPPTGTDVGLGPVGDRSGRAGAGARAGPGVRRSRGAAVRGPRRPLRPRPRPGRARPAPLRPVRPGTRPDRRVAARRDLPLEDTLPAAWRPATAATVPPARGQRRADRVRWSGGHG